MTIRRVVTAVAAAALATGGVFAAAPAYAGHATEPDCRRLNAVETQLCQTAVKIPSYMVTVDGVRFPAPTGRAQVRTCRDRYTHPGAQLTACLAAIHAPTKR